MADVYVIGAGMVGSAMALDLAFDHRVFAADIDEGALTTLRLRNPNIQTTPLDFSDVPALQSWLKPADIVLCAVPGFLGLNTLKTIIEAGKNTVDISFSPEDFLPLYPLAEEKGITVIVDSGVAPGIPNYLLGLHNEQMELDSFEYMVGGLPQNPQPPFNYKAPFSPIDVIEEYTRPARMQVNGRILTHPALSDIESVSFEPVGMLEAFNTDGLRSILKTMAHIPNMKEKTLRFPGHAAQMQTLSDGGFFSDQPLKIKGQSISPLNLTAELLFKEWELKPNEPEFTLLKITLKGKEKGLRKSIVYSLYDEYNLETKTSSMARTTGYTATAAINLVLNGHFTEKGLFPPELVGKDQNCTAFILQYLKARGVTIKKKSNKQGRKGSDPSVTK